MAFKKEIGSTFIAHFNEMNDGKGHFIFGTKKEREREVKETESLEDNKELEETLDEYEANRNKK